eukprot:4283789-Lingulodinium_polyedra.AAC.1
MVRLRGRRGGPAGQPHCGRRALAAPPVQPGGRVVRLGHGAVDACGAHRQRLPDGRGLDGAAGAGAAPRGLHLQRGRQGGHPRASGPAAAGRRE